MAIQKQLGQSAPVADSDTLLYTNTNGLEVSNMIMTCCNHGNTDDTVHIFQDDDGALNDVGQALYHDYPVAAADTVRLAIGPMSTTNGTIYVNSVLAHVTFTLHGTEKLIT